MGDVIVTLKIMPDGVETDLEKVSESVGTLIVDFGGEVHGGFQKEPVAFGLVALKVTFISDEAKGGTDDLEAKIADLEGVAGVEVAEVKRAFG